MIDSYPTKWNYYDTLGRTLYEQKQRIRTKLQQQNQRYEIEMISEIGSGSSGMSNFAAPNGYYG